MIAADCTRESKLLDKQIFRQLAASVTRGQPLAAVKRCSINMLGACHGDDCLRSQPNMRVSRWNCRDGLGLSKPSNQTLS
jgi:hypothetical protein